MTCLVVLFTFNLSQGSTLKSLNADPVSTVKYLVDIRGPLLRNEQIQHFKLFGHIIPNTLKNYLKADQPAPPQHHHNTLIANL